MTRRKKAQSKNENENEESAEDDDDVLIGIETHGDFAETDAQKKMP